MGKINNSEGIISFFFFLVGYSPFVKLILLFCFLKQATIAERANAFRRHCELAETIKLKEINLYGFVHIVVCFACVSVFKWPSNSLYFALQ